MIQLIKSPTKDCLLREQWKDVIGYEGLYEVSSLGRVRALGNGGSNISRRRILYQHTDKRQGYKTVALYKGNGQKRISVHRLVAMAFIPNPLNKREVNHINEITGDNNVLNLQWATSKENSNYGLRNQKISIANKNGKQSKKVYQYDKNGNLIKIWPSAMQCSREGFSQGCVSRCALGQRKTYKGFIWKYDTF